MTLSRRDLLLGGAGVGAALAGAGLTTSRATPDRAQQSPPEWDREADVVVIGSGATGLPAAIVAREAGSSVILVEAQRDIGGHAITSGGNVALGGGTTAQEKYGIVDSPDLLFQDLTDWSVVEPNGFPDYRYNDRELIRAFADNSASTFEWLVPQTSLIALLVNPNDPDAQRIVQDAQETLHTKGVQLRILKASTEGEIDAAFVNPRRTARWCAPRRC